MSDGTIRVIRIIARLNVGGPAKHVAWLTAALQDGDFSSLLVTGTVPAGEEDMSYFAQKLNIQPFYIREMSREISWKDCLTIWKLFLLFLSERPQIIHTHTAKAGTVGRCASFLYRWLTPGTLVGHPRICKVVHTYHGHIFHGYYGPTRTKLFIQIERLLARAVTDKIVVLSEQQRREINETFRVGRPEQFQVVPLGLDLKIFADQERRRTTFRRELGVGDDTLLIGIVGRLTEIKNHEMFLKALAQLKLTSVSTAKEGFFKAVVIGEGNLRESLESKSESLGLTEDVVFCGSRDDPENFYPALDIVALTSKNEGTPLTLIEAMANSRAVISTAVGGVTDLLGEVVESKDGFARCQRGLMVAKNDVEGFAAGLRTLTGDPALREDLGRRARPWIEKQHTVERLIFDIKLLYKNLISTSKID